MACYWSTMKICGSNLTEVELSAKNVCGFTPDTCVNPLTAAIPMEWTEFDTKFHHFKSWCDQAFPLRNTQRKWLCGWKQRQRDSMCTLCSDSYSSLLWGGQRPQSHTTEVTPRPPAVCPVWALRSHPSSTDSSSPAKPGLGDTAPLKAAQQSRASVCARRSKCETDSQICGTGWQSSTAICYPHNHPIKRRNRVWWILRTLLREKTQREGAR